jgi:hypothetical protein
MTCAPKTCGPTQKFGKGGFGGRLLGGRHHAGMGCDMGCGTCMDVMPTQKGSMQKGGYAPVPGKSYEVPAESYEVPTPAVPEAPVETTPVNIQDRAATNWLPTPFSSASYASGVEL